MMPTSSSANRRPSPGDVIAYSFLWSHEVRTGREEAVKARPCAVVLAVGEGDNPLVVVAPITSREPERPEAIVLGAGAAGLDRPSWIVPWELNVFRWPGPDLGRAAQPAGAWWRLGVLAPHVRRTLRDRVEALLKARRARTIER